MSSRRVGVEEEYSFATLDLVGPHNAADYLVGRHQTKRELFRFQLEFASSPHSDLDTLATELWTARAGIADDCRSIGAVPFCSGFHPVAMAYSDEHIGNRHGYHSPVDIFGASLTEHFAAGTHVHVEVNNEIEACNATSYSRPWLPLLLGLFANSPFAHSRPTGFQSFRHISYRMIPTYGPPPPALNVDQLEETHRALGQRGLDGGSGQLYWIVRPSRHTPTIEFRVFDSAQTVSDALAMAILCRSIVDLHLLSEPMWEPSEIELSLELHRAATHGWSAGLCSPVSGASVPPKELRETLAALTASVIPQPSREFLNRWLHDRVNATAGSAGVEAYVAEAADAFLAAPETH